MRNTTTMIDPKALFKKAPVFASFAVKDIDPARQFYGRHARPGRSRWTRDGDPRDPQPRQVARAGLSEAGPPARGLHGAEPAGADIDETVDALTSVGVKFERYNTADIKTDAKGVARGEKQPGAEKGPSIAWFRDPSGNIVSVMEGQS